MRFDDLVLRDLVAASPTPVPDCSTVQSGGTTHRGGQRPGLVAFQLTPFTIITTISVARSTPATSMARSRTPCNIPPTALLCLPEVPRHSTRGGGRLFPVPAPTPPNRAAVPGHGNASDERRRVLEQTLPPTYRGVDATACRWSPPRTSQLKPGTGTTKPRCSCRGQIRPGF